MPLPFLEAETARPCGLTGRRATRCNTVTLAKKWVNRLVALFSFYELGAEALTEIPKLAALQPSSAQRNRASLLLQEVLPWIRAGPQAPKYNPWGPMDPFWALVVSIGPGVPLRPWCVWH